MTMLSTLFGGRIKSIQRVTIVVAANAASNTATITAVDTAKTFVITNGAQYVGPQVGSATGTIVLTNSTTVTATRALDATYPTTFAFTVVEFY